MPCNSMLLLSLHNFEKLVGTLTPKAESPHAVTLLCHALGVSECDQPHLTTCNNMQTRISTLGPVCALNSTSHLLSQGLLD